MIVKLILSLILAGAMAQTALLGVSNLYIMQAQRALEGDRVTQTDVEVADAFYSRATALDPVNPAPRRWAVQLAMQQARSDVELREALDLLRALLEEQPHSATLWAQLFVLKLDLSEADEERSAALARVNETGPFDPVARFYLIEAGTARWLRLSRQEREVMLDYAALALSSAAQFKAGEVANLLRKRGFSRVICARFPAGNRHCPPIDA